MMFTYASAVLALAASASAHMILEYPVPFGKSTLNQSPLAPGDFPCKQRPGVYDVTEMNEWNAGETKTISFLGSAVHGGGSCQFSVTTDKEPNEKSQWKVIQSVIGGCPSNATGNLEPADAQGHGAATFPVTMPKNMPGGQYTFAWTWLNKRGNREFYMNCAPIKVGGGDSASASDASSALGSLPDMFVANVPDTSCSTKEDQDFEYPNPGQNVVKGAQASPGSDLIGGGCASMTAMGAGAGNMGSPSQPTGSPSQPSDAPSAPEPTSAPAEEPAPSNPGGVFAPGASSGGAPQATPIAAQPTPAPSNPEPTGSPSTPSTPSTPSSGDCTPCDNDGAVVCIGSDSFGLCNRGCAVAQALAAGMTCANGSITRRGIRFPRAHLHRRHGSQLI